MMNFVKCSLILLLLQAFSFQSFGTAQTPDILIYKTDTLMLESFPLERYPNWSNMRKRLFGDKTGCIHTGCWRGYRANWEIIDRQLYLTDIYSCCYSRDKIEANLALFFGKKYENGRVRADWVTAEIISSKGQRLFFDYSSDRAVYEGQWIFMLKDGALVGTKYFDNSRSKQSEYTRNLGKTASYLYSQIAWDVIPKIETPIRVLLQFSANEKGKVDSVRILRGYNDLFDNEAIRVVKSIPQWNVVYRLGQLERRTWTWPIVFSESNRSKYSTTK